MNLQQAKYFLVFAIGFSVAVLFNQTVEHYKPDISVEQLDELYQYAYQKGALNILNDGKTKPSHTQENYLERKRKDSIEVKQFYPY